MNNREFADFEKVIDLESAKRFRDDLKVGYENGDGVSGYLFSMFYSSGFAYKGEYLNQLVAQDEIKERDVLLRSFFMLLKNAREGDFTAMNILSIYYQSGLPPLVQPDMSEAMYWSRLSGQVIE